jgi:hypothetical protein
MPLRRGRPHHQPWPLCRFPDGRGRHSENSLRRRFGSLRNCGRRRSHQPLNAFVRYASEPNSRERCASMTENLTIFDARHGAGSFHPIDSPRQTAQDCLTRGNGAIWRRPGSYLVNVGWTYGCLIRYVLTGLVCDLMQLADTTSNGGLRGFCLQARAALKSKCYSMPVTTIVTECNKSSLTS